MHHPSAAWASCSGRYLQHVHINDAGVKAAAAAVQGCAIANVVCKDAAMQVTSTDPRTCCERMLARVAAVVGEKELVRCLVGVLAAGPCKHACMHAVSMTMAVPCLDAKRT